MFNPKFKNIETGEIVDALMWAKTTFMDTRNDLIRQGEIDKTESIPTDIEFINIGIVDLEADEEYVRI